MPSGASSKLAVDIAPSRDEMGAQAARYVMATLVATLASQARARVVFACAPSQDEFLAALTQEPLDWSRVDAFHMDEYLGLGATSHPASFQNYLEQHFLRHVKIGSLAALNGESSDPEKEALRYAQLLAAAPLDLICLGIGENGHIAFNDPPVADFDDPALVKVVALDHACRQQQVNDGCFRTLTAVPLRALTLTIPVFRSAKALSIVVPGLRKAQAVASTCHGPVTTKCPASILRTHPRARLFLDTFAALQLAV